MKKQALEERLVFYVTEKGNKDNSSNKLLLAASAVAGAGAILIPPPAEAAIVYSGLKNKEVTKSAKTATVDFNGGGAEFTFTLSSTFSYSYSQKLAVSVPGSAAVIINTSTSVPANLPADYSISSAKPFTNVSSSVLAASNPSVYGNFLNKQGFLGVKFVVKSGIHYGWIQYKTNEDASVGTIIDWAYEDTPEKAIKTGDTGKKFNWNLFLPAITTGNKNK